MSTVNAHYTFQYSQPEDYRFSHDSVFLARWVFESLHSEDLKKFSCLDLCAGCGVIGLDFIFHLLTANKPTPKRFDFLEVQEIYQSHFQINQAKLPAHTIEIHWRSENYQKFSSTECYDLILCNPPYFRLGQGKLSPSDFKNRCRFFIDSDYPELLQSFERNLNPQGRAYVLLRDLQDHGWNPLQEARTHFSDIFDIQVVTQIRGTDVVCFTKNS